MAKITLEKLAQMVGNGFNDMVERFKRVDGKFAQIDNKFERIDDKFAQVNNQLKEVDKRFSEMDTDIRYIKAELLEVKSDVIQIKENTTPLVEFEDLSDRVRYVERKLGIKSGKRFSFLLESPAYL